MTLFKKGHYFAHAQIWLIFQYSFHHLTRNLPMKKKTHQLLLLLVIIALSTPAISSNAHDWNWPYKRSNIEIINNISTLQFYGPYPGFHHGLDILSDGEEKVYAPASGKVGTRYYYKRKTPYTYEVYIDLVDGYRIELHHIDLNTIPKEIEALAKVNGHIEKGTYLGTIYDSTKMGIPMHLHTNLVSPDGIYTNPLRRYPKIVDNTPPIINEVFIATPNEKGYLKIKANELSQYSEKENIIAVNAYEVIANSEQRLGIYKLQAYSMKNGSKKLLKTILFDELPEKRFTKGTDMYLTKPVEIDGKLKEPGKMNKTTQREFIYKIPLSKDISKSPEKYILQIDAIDFNGNLSSKTIALDL